MSAQEKTEARKEMILMAAAKVFGKKGYHEGTIPEIASEAGVSEASIYDYFNNKENLLFSIPEMSIEHLDVTIDFHLKLIKGCVNKLRAILMLTLQSYIEFPHFAAVIMLILKHSRAFLNTSGHQSVRLFVKRIDDTIQEGIENVELRSDVDPYLLRSALLGAMEHITINWLLVKKPDDEELIKTIDPMIELFFKGAQNRPETKQCPFENIVNPAKENISNKK